jgi:hypothetical protein
VRRTLTAAFLVLVGYTIVHELAEVTQNRPDPPRTDRATELVVTLRTRHGEARRADARALWEVCHRQSFKNRLVGDIEEVELGRFRLVLHPALGEHSRRRVVGCLEDTTLDGLLGRVRILRDVSYPSYAGAGAGAGSAGQTP